MTTNKLHINTFAGYEGETLEAMYAVAQDDSVGGGFVTLAVPVDYFGTGEHTMLVEVTAIDLYIVRDAVDRGKPRKTIELALCSYITESYSSNVAGVGFCETMAETILPAMAENLSPIAEAIKASWTDLFNLTNPTTR